MKRSALLLLAVLMLGSALGYATHAAQAPANSLDEPVVVTRRMLADLVCLIFSNDGYGTRLYEFDATTQSLRVRNLHGGITPMGVSADRVAEMNAKMREGAKIKAQEKVARLKDFLGRHGIALAQDVTYEGF